MPFTRNDIDERCKRIDDANTDDFAELVREAGLDKARHFRHADWSGVSFRGSDLRGFDFTAARLLGCDFTGAKIKGAWFVQAELGAVDLRGRDNPNAPGRVMPIANLRTAADWAEYVAALAGSKTWAPPGGPCDAAHLPVGAIFSDAPGLTPELVVIPPGSFLMGSPEEEEGRFDSEGPRHRVDFHRPFAIGRFPVTVAEFQIFRGKKKSAPGEEDNHPVTEVSWDDAVAFCDWLNKRLGLPSGTYRLPSESEWEYACRAGTDTPYWWGREWDAKRANGMSGGTSPVDRYEPNGWGLHDMLGNVWEWCQDNWHDDYGGNPPTDGSVWEGGESGRRVLRGGSWSGNGPRNLRSAFRFGINTGVRVSFIGFRVARTL